MLLGDVGDDVHLLRRQNGAGGVAGVGDEDGPRPLRDQGLDPAALGVVVALLRGAVDGADAAPRHVDEGIVVGVEGLRDQDLVPLVQDAAHGHLQRLAAAAGGQDVPLRQGRADALVVALDSLHIRRHAGGGRVGQHLAAVAVNGVKEGRRRGDIRLADVQVMDLHPPGLRLQGVGMELAHGGELALPHLGRKLHLKFLLIKKETPLTSLSGAKSYLPRYHPDLPLLQGKASHVIR